jgi:hypothetical protein
MQQFPFIDLFKSAVHVSGDVFSHLQEQFTCRYIQLWCRPAADLLPTGDMVSTVGD